MSAVAKVQEFLSRLRFVISRKSHGDLDDELAFHLEQSIQQKISDGLTPGEARRQALIEFGGVERTREQCYEQRPSLWMENIGQDVRYALRGFRRSPIFTVTAIVTLALGIGSTTAVFSVVDRILFRSLPYGNADRLVSVGLTAPINPQEFMLGGSYYDWRDNQKPFESFAAEGISDACDLTENNPARLTCAKAEAGLLPTLGVSTVLGRNFLPEEDRPNGPKVALISYALWRTHYNLDASVLNRLIKIDGKDVRVVGVLPKDFEMPDLLDADVVLPLALDEAAQRKDSPGAVLYAFARLKPGMSIERATAELQPVFEYSLSLAPAPFRKEVHFVVRSLRDRQMHDVREIAFVLLGAVLALLLIACSNVASLFLTRGAARERELAVRSALGASRGRLVRQTLTEVLMITLAGAAASWVLAVLLLRVFVYLAPAGILFLDKAHLDLRIMLFSGGLSLICGVLFGLVPAMQRPRASSLSARSAGSRSQAFLRRALVMGQIAVSIVLLSSAALLLRSFRNLQLQNLGMQTGGVLTAAIDLPQYRYATPQKQMEFFLRAEAALRALPGVSRVGLTDTLPPGGMHHEQIYSNIKVAGQPPSTAGTGGMVTWRWVTPAYFQGLDISILRGRTFTEADRTSSQQVMILSSLLASRMFGNNDPIGQRVQPIPEGHWYTIVGIAADVKNAGLASPANPEFYRLRRNKAEDWDGWGATLIAETSLPAKTSMPWVRTQIAQIDPTVPIDVGTLDQQVNKLADRPRFESALLGFFAFTGLVMAVIGIYGVTAFMVMQRTQEVGVRMALGATRANILRLILWDGVRLISLGGVLGLIVALAVSSTLKSLLFSVGPHDPATFAGVAIFLGTVSLAATLLPARSATRVDPAVALRHD
ncbi:putative permease [Granulicella aggregans]|uniref:Putative permease n=1 Tax=Granulicella aggregans TaxID=474949 RepID=A0A7W8E2M1_9BACT|nr:ABC transporter permease [Granulicella aggregans]MBB5056672.1 putative permease [Granulicella aggregans]